MSRKLYDISTTLANYGYDPRQPEIKYWHHSDTARYYAGVLNLQPEAFKDGEGLNTELVTANTHTGTHMDAP